MGNIVKKIKNGLVWLFGGFLLCLAFLHKNKSAKPAAEISIAALKARKEKEAEIEKTDPFDLLADSSNIESHIGTTDEIKSDLRDRIGERLQRRRSSSDNQ